MAGVFDSDFVIDNNNKFSNSIKNNQSKLNILPNTIYPIQNWKILLKNSQSGANSSNLVTLLLRLLYLGTLHCCQVGTTKKSLGIGSRTPDLVLRRRLGMARVLNGLKWTVILSVKVWQVCREIRVRIWGADRSCRCPTAAEPSSRTKGGLS